MEDIIITEIAATWHFSQKFCEHQHFVLMEKQRDQGKNARRAWKKDNMAVMKKKGTRFMGQALLSPGER